MVLVFKAHRLVYHSILGWRVIMKKKKVGDTGVWLGRAVLGVQPLHPRPRSISFEKSTPPQNRQLDILISNRQQSVDDFGGELNELVIALCEIKSRIARHQDILSYQGHSEMSIDHVQTLGI